MKIFTNKNFIQKLIIAIVSVILLNFCFAPPVHASFGGTLMDLMVSFSTAIGDVVGSLVQFGVTGKWGPAVDENGSGQVLLEEGEERNSYWIKDDEFKYPVLQVSPELIFANEIEILDANFITSDDGKKFIVGLEDKEALDILRRIIASWYVTLRTIAVVGLLSVLIYIGIRIIISSTSADKAKYKQRLLDWVIAFCLLFFMHYIMAATLTVVEKVNDVLASMTSVNDGLEINPEYGKVEYVGEQSTASQETELYDKVYNSKEEGAMQNIYSQAVSDVKDIIAGKGYIYVSEDTVWRDRHGKPFIWTPLEESGGKNVFLYYIYYQNSEGDRIKVTVKSTETWIAGDNKRWPKFAYGISEADGQFDVDTVKNDIGFVSENPEKVLYFVNYARLFLNYEGSEDNMPIAVTYLIIYIALITFTAMFAIRYIKRVIYVAFLTLMAPMVALTYPLDKIKDRKSSGLEYVV